MDSLSVKKLVEHELARGDPFTNFHGITPRNIALFLVEPFLICTDPDDAQSQPRDMWVVLQERDNPNEGYVIVYDPTIRAWGVAEQGGDGNYKIVVAASTLPEALSGM